MDAKYRDVLDSRPDELEAGVLPVAVLKNYRHVFVHVKLFGGRMHQNIITG